MIRKFSITLVVALLIQLLFGALLSVIKAPIRQTVPLTFNNEHILKHTDEVIHDVLLQDIAAGENNNDKYEDVTIKKAMQFIDMYLIESEQIEPPETLSLWSVKQYVEELNRLAFKFFSYKSGRAVERFSQQQADCDMYSYLIQSAANLQGIKLNVIMSPGHAFLNWDNTHGPDLTWESTSNGFVNLSNTDLYKVDFSNTAYIYADSEVIKHNALVQYVFDNTDDFSKEELGKFSAIFTDVNSPYSVLYWELFSQRSDTYEELIARDPAYALQAYNEYPSDYYFNVGLRTYFLHSGDDKKVVFLDKLLINDSEATSNERLTYFLSSQISLANTASLVNHTIFSAIPSLLGERYTYKTFKIYENFSLLLWIVSILIMMIIYHFRSLESTIRDLRNELNNQSLK